MDNNEEGKGADADQSQQEIQPVSLQQQVRPIHAIPPRRMMWPGARPRFMGARPAAPMLNQQPTNGFEVPTAPVPFCPYPGPPLVGRQAASATTNQAEVSAEASPGEAGANQAQRGRPRSRPRGAMVGGPHRGSPGQRHDMGDAAAVQHAMAAYWLIWSWLTQLHNNYDLNITLSVKPSSQEEAAQSDVPKESDEAESEGPPDSDKKTDENKKS